MPPVKVRGSGGSLTLGFALHIALYTLAADTYYIVKGAQTDNCKDDNCTTRAVSKHEVNAVRCCADFNPQSSLQDDEDSPGRYFTWSKHQETCKLWVLGIQNDFCYMAQWEKARWVCELAGGRLCNKTELENGCAANNENSGCDFDAYMIWSSTPGELISSDYCVSGEYYHVVQGNSKKTCWESESNCEADFASQCDSKAVRCCSDKKPQLNDVVGMGWVKENCELWSWSTFSFCYLVNWTQAKEKCSEVGGRLCTLDELKGDCTKDSGCFFNRMMVWSNQSATLIPTVVPTDSPEYPTMNPTFYPTDTPAESLSGSPTQSSDAPTSNPTPIPGQTQSTHSYTPTTSSTRVPSADCIETEQNWTEEIAKQLCSAVEMGVTKKGVDALVCPDYNQYYQRRLNYSLANGAFTHCSAWCVYDAYKEGYGDPSERYDAFIWRRWNGCYQPIRSGVCIYGNINDRDEMADYIDALCESCPSYTWDDDRAEELCPLEYESKKYGVEVCDDPKSSTKQDSLDKSLANRFFTHCHAFCVYDYDTIMNNARNLSYTYGGYIWKRTCWKWVTDWDCFTKHISEFKAVSLRAVNQCEL